MPILPAKKFEEDKKQSEEEKKDSAAMVPQVQSQMAALSMAASVDPAEKAEQEAFIDRNLSAEYMDSDDLGGGLNLSDDERGTEQRNMRKEFKKQRRAVKNERATSYQLEFDANVFEVKLDCLADKG